MPLVKFDYPGQTALTLKIEKIYERISKEIKVQGFGGKTIVSVDLGLISNLMAFEGYIPTTNYTTKKSLKEAAKVWKGSGTSKAITITIPYEDDTFLGVFKSLTITYIEGERQWKFTAEFAEYIQD